MGLTTAERISPFLESIGSAVEFNAGAFQMLCREIEKSGKEIEDMSVGELSALIEETRLAYNRIYS